MWGVLSSLAIFDAGRAVRTRIGTFALYAVAGLVAGVGVIFALVAARSQLVQVMSPVFASLTIAALLFVLAGLVLLYARFRTVRGRNGPEFSKAMLATVPFAGAMVRKVSPGTAIALVVLIAAAFLGSRIGRKR